MLPSMSTVFSLPTRDWNPFRHFCFIPATAFLAYLRGIETLQEGYGEAEVIQFLAYLRGIETPFALSHVAG